MDLPHYPRALVGSNAHSYTDVMLCSRFCVEAHGALDWLDKLMWHFKEKYFK